MKGGMGSHERTIEGETDDWLTPPWITDALGPFDLDPCASQFRDWNIAKVNISPPNDGRRLKWWGTVWLNPPYGRETWEWLNLMAEYEDKGKAQGLALVFARTETRGFVEAVWEKADAILFLNRRIKFCRPRTGEDTHSNAGAPSCLVAYGNEMVDRLVASGIDGYLVTSWERNV